MNLLQKMEHWGNKHHPKWVDIIRIALGLYLCYKGVVFLQNMSTLINIIRSKATFGEFTYILLGHFVVFAHILGGILIATGFYTRFACVVQIPILIVAVFFVNIGGSMMRPYAELFLSILVLGLLIYFLIIGNGAWSVKMDEKEKKNNR